MSFKVTIAKAFQNAITEAFGPAFSTVDPLIKPTPRPELGDYQANFAMSLSKTLGKNPREVALLVTEKLKANSLFNKIDIAGPGFINVFLTETALTDTLLHFDKIDRFGVQPPSPETIVIDYGSPNVAKEMHVGHLRSTVLGDALVRILGFMGHRVIRQNHLGDWGTQFGMLIQAMIEDPTLLESNHAISDLNTMYQAAKRRDDTDADFAKRARERVVLLQQGDSETLALWKKLVTQSQQYFNKIYQRLGVLLTDDDIRGESAYNALLPQTVQDLLSSGVATHSEGAIVVFLEEFRDKDDKPVPMIIQKSDGGHLYATTDLAAVRYRIETLGANRIIYVVDSRQTQHLAMLFAAARKQGWANNSIRLEHAAFGSILGPDRRPFKTRSGETIKLVDLLNEAAERAAAILLEKNPNITEEDKQTIVHAISIGAIKYGDLCSERIKDYVFDWDRMLSFDGNSAPYLLNAYVRIQSLFRKAGNELQIAADISLSLKDAAEKQLALKLLAFPDIIAIVAADLAPHHLCHYLCELAACFHTFYEKCPILKAEPSLRDSRLRLSDITARVLHQGLTLLGIETIDHM